MPASAKATIFSEIISAAGRDLGAPRLMLFACGAPNAADETFARSCAHDGPLDALDRGGALHLRGVVAAAEEAYSPLKHCVHANSHRLFGAIH